MASLSRRRRTLDIWPGFVDALASLLMVFVFVLLIFMLAQFFLTDTLAGRNKALHQLTEGINALADTLALEQQKSEALERDVETLNRRLQATLAERDSAQQHADSLQAALEEAQRTIRADREQIELKLAEIASLQQDIVALRQVRDQLESQIGQLEAAVAERDQTIASVRDRSKALEAQLADEAERTRLAQVEIDQQDIRLRESENQIALLNQQIQVLRQQLTSLAAALDASEAVMKEQKIEIAELGRRLNVALAQKVEELNRYRSEFFGRLREVLGDHPDIRIVGDRFLFQSELLFASGSARLGDDGKRQLAQLAKTLKEVAERIPSDIEWVLQVDGHTDRRPINTPEFPSNWELSVARALSIVRYLTEQGIPAHRLAAAGFGEYHPLDKGSSPEAFARNRRIEIKLTGN